METEKKLPASKGPPGFRSAMVFWLKLGLIGFGGPAAQIAIMHRELVETQADFLARSYN